MWFVYIIQHYPTKDKYIGLSEDIEKRVADHNNGKNNSTKRNSGYWK